jgi:hypothetical protein
MLLCASATLTWLWGAHTFKFGADLRRFPDQLYDPQLLTDLIALQ